MANDKPTFAKQMKKFGTPAQQEQKVVQKLGVSPNPSKISQQAAASTTQNNKIPVTQMSKKECTNFCRPTGINILPLKYSVARLGVKPLPAQLGGNVTNVPLKEYKYTVRMIDSGYIYLLIKRKSGKKEWVAYITNKKGFHQEFAIGSKAPIVAQDFACNKAGHSANASLITIPSVNNDDAQTVYLLHAHAPLTKKMREKFEKNADQYATSGYWQKIDVTKGAVQQHCLSSAQLSTVALPLESYGSARWGAINKKFGEKPKEHIGVALYDPIGITSKLNEDRNILSFKGIDSFLKEDKDGFSNEHKLQTMTLIDNMKQNLVANSIQAKFKIIDSNEQQSKKITDPYLQAAIQRAERLGDKTGLENLKNVEKNAPVKAAAELEKKRAEAIKQATVDGDTAWKKYQAQLNMNSLEKFRKDVDKKSEESYSAAARYLDDHYNWLVSSNLLKGLFYFDQSEELKQGKVSKESNGFIFHAVIMDLMYGMNLLQKGKDLLNKWICEKKVPDKNLFLRAYCFNNKVLMDEYAKIFESPSSAKDLLDYSKQSFSMFTAADAAFDSWLGSIEGKKFISANDFKWPDKLFYWISLMLNTALKEFGDIRLKTIHISQITVMATQGAQRHTAQLLYLRSGNLAQQIPLMRLMYNLEFRAAAISSLPQSGMTYTYRNTRAIEIKNSVSLAVKGQPDITKNRILAIVGVFELLNFYFQYDAWKSDIKDKPELAVQLAGASFTLTAVAFDMLGESWLNKGVNVANKAQAFKLFAATLGTIGGIIGLIVDYKALQDTDDKIIKNLLRIKYTASVFLAIGQVLSLFTTIVSYSSKEIAKKMGERITSNLIASALMGSRAIAGLTVITIAAVALEFYLRKCVLDDEMEDWCQKSAFHKSDSKEKLYKTVDEEYEGFMKAIVSV
ncbi:T6SS effector BTH_I2691 family protein [Acinetobacter sp. V102_4]|uniref:T6SS effector BTH_I2691 family protein n=1 Tax=Acinetobacter sp. V102_4 TaxID=3072984 RepID=UPI00287D577E|nr:T6SS effector BTH_I2691 family protein [Acinetobacter sp. V102_4]MDS7929455.1 T6SS effector BTH_I2691 family protein [Acinetobacter sp. V102_4]